MKKLPMITLTYTIIAVAALIALSACGDAGGSGNSGNAGGKSNVDLLKEAIANMNALKSYHLDIDVNQGGAPVKMNGDFDIANDRASLGMNFGVKTNYMIRIGNDSYTSLDDGKTYQNSQLKMSFKLWEGVKPEDIDKVKDALKDGAPPTEKLDGVETRHIIANGKDFPSLNTGIASSAIEGTVELWVSTDARPSMRQMKIDGKSNGDPVTGTLKWSKFDEKFSIEAPPVGPTATPFVFPSPVPENIPSSSDCKPVPASQNMTIEKPCYLEGELGLESYTWSAEGFKANESVLTKLTGPDGVSIDGEWMVADSNGYASYQVGAIARSGMVTGQYTQTAEGQEGGHKAIGYFYFVMSR